MSTNPFFQQEQSCPVCDQVFSVTRVKSSSYGVKTRHTDFCNEYEGVNPLLYEIWVCPNCYYASSFRDFAQDFLPKEKLRLNKALSLFKNQEEPDFCGERGFEVALRSFELAIRTNQIRKTKAGLIAPLTLKAAWLCRSMEQLEQEKLFLQEAKKFYLKAFELEGHQGGKLSEVGLAYLIGELHRRTGDYKDAVSWFSRAVSLPDAKREPEIVRMAREQWQLSKASYIAQGGKEELDSNPEPATEVQEPVPSTKINYPSTKRNKVKIFASIYEDQALWLQSLGNSIYNETKTTITKEEILRALLETLMTFELDVKSATSEAELIDLFKAKLTVKTQ